MFRIVAVISVILTALVAGVIVVLLSYSSNSQNTAQPSSATQAVRPQFRSSVINPSVFVDGIGIYSREDNNYSMLVWKKRLINDRGGVDEKDIQDAFQQAIPVKRTVKFFAYGLNISSWPVVPPYSMGFCYVPNLTTVAGIFPLRIIPMDSQIYELIPPPVIDDLASGVTKHLFWGINYQYSCKDAWVFKFTSP